MMNRILIAIFVLLSIPCYADIATEVWPKKLRDVPRASKPITVQGYKIMVREAADQSAGGSGGGIYDITVQNIRMGTRRLVNEQSVGVAVLEFYDGWPQLEIWSRAGGGSWCRSLYRFVGGDYKYVRTDEFTEFDFHVKDKTRTTTMPGSDDILYFVETRLPEKP